MASSILRTVTIPNGTTPTNSFRIGSAEQGSFSTPAAITGATLQQQFSNNGTNWTAVGSAVSVTANNTYPMHVDMFKARFGRLVSASNEAAARVITLSLKF